MKTDELVTLLAAGTVAVERGAGARRYAIALGWGAFASALLMAILLGVRPDISAAARLPMFWIKLAFPAALAVGGLFAALRMSRPGGRLGNLLVALAAPVAALWLLSVYALLDAPASERTRLVLGGTWQYCLLSVPLLSAPILVATFWAMKGLAPTRLSLAGASAGLLAGAIGAFVYAFHCPEMQAPFLGTWYVAGMSIPAAAGALLGPLLLRW
ncbi:MAG TPA: DUF1109 domain-containing protein [Casimicrobiaceae bacterium]|jgi:hypothetical protein